MLTVDEWKHALRARMRAARSARDSGTVTVLGDALAAIENAEALPVPAAAPTPGDGPFAGSAGGLGAAEAPRLVLSPEDVIAILKREVSQRRAAAAEYATLGRAADAEALRSQADVLHDVMRAALGR